MEPGTAIERQGAVFVYILISVVSVLLNKNFVETYKRLPATTTVLLGQTVVTVVSGYLLRTFNIVQFPNFNKKIILKVHTLALLHVEIVICGLAMTELSQPTFEPLQRFSIIITVVAEVVMFDTHISNVILSSIAVMIISGMVGLNTTLTEFNPMGWLATILQGVLISFRLISLKKRLYAEVLGKYGILFYSNVVMLPLAAALCYFTGEMHLAYNYPWSSSSQVQFITMCAYGIFMTLAFITCAQYNSATTTAVVPCTQHLVVAFGEFAMSTKEAYDLKFGYFASANIATLACITYFYFEFKDAILASKGYQTLNKCASVGSSDEEEEV